jgi:hypothetical protein
MLHREILKIARLVSQKHHLKFSTCVLLCRVTCTNDIGPKFEGISDFFLGGGYIMEVRFTAQCIRFVSLSVTEIDMIQHSLLLSFN